MMRLHSFVQGGILLMSQAGPYCCCSVFLGPIFRSTYLPSVALGFPCWS